MSYKLIVLIFCLVRIIRKESLVHILIFCLVLVHIYNLTHFNNQLIFGEFQTLKKIKNSHFVFVPHVEFISEFIIDLHFICNQSITFPRAQDLIVVCVWPFNEQIRYPNNEML